MTEERLRELARRLDRELENAGSISAGDRAMLTELKEEISRAVGDRAPSLRDRASQAVEHFEKEHPTITLVLKQIIDTLERIGI